MEAALNSPLGRTTLGPLALKLGRAADNTLVIPDQQASSYHAEITPGPGGNGYQVTDLGSTNGTFVNEQRLAPRNPRMLNPGDVIRIGQTKLTYQIGTTSQDVTIVADAPGYNSLLQQGGGYNQQRQQVGRDQYNAEGDINLYRSYQQQGQQVRGNQYNAEGNINQYGDYVGRDKAGRDIVRNQYRVDTAGIGSGIKQGVKIWLIVSLISFLFVLGLIGVGGWFVYNQIQHSFPNGPTNPVVGTSSSDPQEVLKTVCGDFQYGNFSDAYLHFTDNYKSTHGLGTFTSQWGGQITSCDQTLGNTSADGKSASGTIVLGIFTKPNDNYNVTLVKGSDGSWKIDNMVKQ